MDCLHTFQLVQPASIHLFASKDQARLFRPAQRYYASCSRSRLGIASYSLITTPFVKNAWCSQLWKQMRIPSQVIPKINPQITSHVLSNSAQPKEMVEAVWKIAGPLFIRAYKGVKGSNLCLQCASAVGLMIFATWGLGPLLRLFRQVVLKKDNRNWKKSQTHFIMSSYLRPLLLWIAVITICRAFDPIVLSSEASQIIKQRVVNFVRSLSTVLAFAYCAASLTQQLQKFVMEREDVQDSRNVGVNFIGNAVYSAVWVAAACLFMELLGFSTQKWLTAGGVGTLLLTLAGREIFTNFLSSIMIHATRPFVETEWIQTKIEGYEVSGTVEHVGWWSPTIIRGDDREAVHIPNHKFTVNVVRNLSQKTHWRIKTHLGISHLDASKIPNIVSDMRKVLAKHPQVEQKRLHRRVFFDNIDPENQALLILVSCFVKTSHFEEYLNVKEIILLDLLKVISHHHARLATPIRSFQKLLDDESRHTSFRDMTSRSGETHGKPFLLIEASSTASGYRDVEKISNDNSGLSRGKVGNVTGSNGSEHIGNEGTSTSSNSELKSVSKLKESAVAEASSKKGSSSNAISSSATMKPQLEGLDSMGLNSKDITLLGAAFEKPPANIPESPEDSKLNEKSTFKSTVEPLFQDPGLRSQKVEKAISKSAVEASVVSLRGEIDAKEDDNAMGIPVELECDLWADARKPDVNPSSSSLLSQSSSSSTLVSSIQEKDRLSQGMSANVRPQLEENLVLGVALDGPKRTLPLDDDIATTGEQKELVTSRNGNGGTSVKGRRDSAQLSPHNLGPLDTRDKEA